MGKQLMFLGFHMEKCGKIWSGLTSNEKNNKNGSCLADETAAEILHLSSRERCVEYRFKFELERVEIHPKARSLWWFRDKAFVTIILSVSIDFGLIKPAAVWSCWVIFYSELQNFWGNPSPMGFFCLVVVRPFNCKFIRWLDLHSWSANYEVGRV